MRYKRQLRSFTFFIIAYMLIALFWWAILLIRNNNTILQLKTSLIYQDKNIVEGKQDIKELPEYIAMMDLYHRRQRMIIGEAIVFALTIGFGIALTVRSLMRELTSTKKQKNFLLSITHELKSPLASINLILDTFVKRNLPREKVVELSHGGISETKRLEDLFNKILIAAKVESSSPFELRKTNLSTLVESTLDILHMRYPDVLIKEDIEANIYVHIDEEAWNSVLFNLYENAIKYSPHEKELKVHLYRFEDTVYLKVSDKGIGISENEKDWIFDQFYRVGSEETRESQGTGLGLYIVREIVIGHKGKIRVIDNKPKGSLFEIVLPIKHKT